MSKFSSRGARLTALALATGTLIVSGTSSASAASIAIPDVFGGHATGTAIRVTVNLPTAIPLSVPGLGGLTAIEQEISFVDGNTAKTAAPQVSVAKAVLGNGTIAPLQSILGLKVESSLSGKQSDSTALLAQNIDGLLDVGVGQITSSVAPDSATSALTSTSSSSLASLKIGLGGLNLPVKTDLNTVLNTIKDTVDPAQGTLTATVNDALTKLNDASNGATAPVADAINSVKSELTNLLDSLQNTLASLSSSTNIVELGLLKSTENITRAGSMVTAKATSEVGGLKILNGLVSVDAVKTESISSANGVQGAAAADTLTTILGLKVGDILDLKLTSNGLEGSVNGTQLPDVAKDAVKQVIDAVNGVLSVAGVQIQDGQTTKNVDPNGKFASSDSTGVGIVVNPPALNLAKPLVAVQLVPAGTAVNALVVPKAPAAPTFKKTGSETPLARTGANLPLFATGGALLVGFALVARRRRTVEA
jgi:hypothetical protein